MKYFFRNLVIILSSLLILFGICLLIMKYVQIPKEYIKENKIIIKESIITATEKTENEKYNRTILKYNWEFTNITTGETFKETTNTDKINDKFGHGKWDVKSILYCHWDYGYKERDKKTINKTIKTKKVYTGKNILAHIKIFLSNVVNLMTGSNITNENTIEYTPYKTVKVSDIEGEDLTDIQNYSFSVTKK